MMNTDIALQEADAQWATKEARELREFKARHRTRAVEIAIRHAGLAPEGWTVLRSADAIARFIMDGELVPTSGEAGQ